MVENSDSSRYRFLHDPVIAAHKRVLFAAWYNCPEGEMIGESVIRGRRSPDGGRSWSEPEVIAQDTDNQGLLYVPAQLLSHHGALHAFVGKMTGPDLIVETVACIRDDRSGTWSRRGAVAALFLPLCQPVKMADGNWIMAGRVASRLGTTPRIAAVALSRGDDLTGRWQVVPIGPELPVRACPETTILVEGGEIVALIRNNQEPVPYVSVSRDFGRTWSSVARHDFSAVSTKLYAGKLSTGQYYLLFNYPQSGRQGGSDRSLLALAVSRPGELAWSRVWKVQEKGLGRPAASHYPCAIEHEGSLLIVYTAGFRELPRRCEMARIPIASLRIA